MEALYTAIESAAEALLVVAIPRGMGRDMLCVMEIDIDTIMCQGSGQERGKMRRLWTRLCDLGYMQERCWQ